MKRQRWFLLLILVVVLGAAIGYFRAPGRSVQPGVAARVMQAASATTRDEQLPPVPALALEVNASDRAELVQGTPLTLTVRINNPRAANAAAANQAHAQLLQDIQQRVARGELTTAAAQPMLDAARLSRPVEPVHVGTPQQGWETFLRFERQSAGGKMELLGWPLSLVAAPDSKSVTLDATASVQLDYALPPQAAARVPAGEYQIVAIVEVPAGGTLPPEHWRGRVVSSPVHVNVRALPAEPSDAERASTNLARAEFFATTKDWANALASAQQALAVSPDLIRAHIVAGQAYEAQENFAAALDAYEQAEALFDKQHPDSYEAPRYLMLKVNELQQKIGR